MSTGFGMMALGAFFYIGGRFSLQAWTDHDRDLAEGRSLDFPGQRITDPRDPYRQEFRIRAWAARWGAMAPGVVFMGLGLIILIVNLVGWLWEAVVGG